MENRDKFGYQPSSSKEEVPPPPRDEPASSADAEDEIEEE